MAYRSSSIVSLATAASVAPTVPTGTAANDIVVVCVYIENNTKTITPPSGFTQKYGPDSITAEHHTYWFWKRPTGSDTGSYTFSWTGAEPCQAVAVAFSGRITTGDPFHASSDMKTLASGTAFPNLSVTADANSDAVAMYSTWTSQGLTPPTGFTTRQNVNEIGIATLDNIAGGTQAANSASWGASSSLVDRLATLLVAGAAPKSLLVPRNSMAHMIVR